MSEPNALPSGGPSPRKRTPLRSPAAARSPCSSSCCAPTKKRSSPQPNAAARIASGPSEVRASSGRAPRPLWPTPSPTSSSPPRGPAWAGGARSRPSIPTPYAPSRRPCLGRCIRRPAIGGRGAGGHFRGFEQELDAVAVLDVRAVDLGFEHQALGVYQEVALPSLHLLGAIVSSLLSAHPGRLDRLAVYDARAGPGVPLQAYPRALTQGGVHPLPDPIHSP